VRGGDYWGSTGVPNRIGIMGAMESREGMLPPRTRKTPAEPGQCARTAPGALYFYTESWAKNFLSVLSRSSEMTPFCLISCKMLSSICRSTACSKCGMSWTLRLSK